MIASELRKATEEAVNPTIDRFDPEQIHDEFDNDSDSSASLFSREGDGDGYELSNKSALRRSLPAELGPRYSGSSIGRDSIYNDRDDPDTEDDSMQEEIYSADEKDLTDGSSDMQSDDGAQKDYQTEELQSEREQSHGRDTDRDELRRLAQNEPKNLVQELTDAARADVEKGEAVRKQRQGYNTLLSTRMQVQKGVTASNQLLDAPNLTSLSKSDRDIIEAVEQAAVSLLSKIDSLKSEFSDSRSTKRPHSFVTGSSSSEIKNKLAKAEASMWPSRRDVLNRWASKTALSTTHARSDKLRSKSAPKPLTDVLEDQLSAPSSYERLLSRTQLARSRPDRRSGQTEIRHEAVYDDTEWYAQLLRDLIENRTETSERQMTGSGASGMPNMTTVSALRRETKTRRSNVDVKASKGRKMRFTVEEKLQNFMVPDDRTTWGKKQVQELFSSLMGGRIRGGLAEDGEEDPAIPDVDSALEQGTSEGNLRLFG